MAKQRYIMANLVYGQLYPQLWLENQIKSLMDQTNLPALKKDYDLEYVLFSDEETLQGVTRHPNFMSLGQVAEIHIVKLGWPADADKFASRYYLLKEMFSKVVPVALEKKAYCSVWVADLVFAKFALPRILSRLDAGHGAVFNVPIRGAADSINPHLHKLNGAPTDLELFELAYRNLHHLWVASHWDAPLFSKFPYSMLWNSGTGFASHHFGITPIAFKPTEEMKSVQGGIDSDLPAMCENPYWAEDWTDAPVAGVEPLSNGHYPPFMVHKASEHFVCDWAMHANNGQPAIFKSQIDYLDKVLYYPNKKMFNAPELAAQAQEIALSIQKKLKQ